MIDGEVREVGEVTDEVEPMTIERAYSMENSEGLNYGEISEDGLASMRTRLEDLLSKLDGTEEDVTLYYNYQEKLAATCPEAIAVGSRSCSRPTRMVVSS